MGGGHSHAGSGKLTELDHVGIAVRDLDAVVAWYEKMFGATVAHRERIGTVNNFEFALARCNGRVIFLSSIVGEMGTQKFARLRVGIGEPERNAISHVLTRFAGDEREVLDEVLEAAADAVEDWARDGAARAANKWNSWSPKVLDEATDNDDATDRPTDAKSRPDAAGIVRTTTGWRKLLQRD